MTDTAATIKDDQPGTLTLETATRLIGIGLSVPRRPVDELIERLDGRRGADWLPKALAAGPLKGLGDPVAMLVHGGASIDQLTLIKERSKKLLEQPSDREERLTGLAGYFLSLAAALCHHGVVIGGRSREELNETLLDLAAVSDRSFFEMLVDASLRGGSTADQ